MRDIIVPPELAHLHPQVFLQAVLATDPMAKIDIPLFCTQNGHGCNVSSDADVMRFQIVKAA